MGCRHSLSKEAQEQRDVIDTTTDIHFSAGDVVDLQGVLWNLLVVAEDGEGTRPVAQLRKMIESVRESIVECGYAPPNMEELAWRLVTDSEERHEKLNDVHFVSKFETEDQVLSQILSGTTTVRRAALEVLLMWYVTTTDCDNMADHLDLSTQRVALPEEEPNPPAEDTAQDDPAMTESSLQSFVWKGSPDLATGNLSFASTNLRGSEGMSPDRNSMAIPQATPGSYACSSPWSAAGSAPTLGIEGVAGSRPGSVVSPKMRPNASLCLSRSQLPSSVPCKLERVVQRLTQPYNAKNLEHLALVLRGAMRCALRRYSTSGYDEEDVRQRSNAQRLAGSEWSRDKAAAIARCNSLSDIPNMGGGGLIAPQVGQFPLTVVLDLDETLVFARRGPLWVRPGVTEFLRTLKAMGCEVVCWTASNRSYAGGILSRLDPLGEYVSQCIYSHPRWAARRGGPQVKNLALIGRDLQWTIIIDNLPDSVYGNEMNAIVVENYEGCELHDTTLATLSKVLHSIIVSGRPVPEFLRTPSLFSSHLRLTERSLHNGTTVKCFMLNSEPASFSLPL